MLTYKPLHDRAVVSFTGAVDWPSTCNLVDFGDALAPGRLRPVSARRTVPHLMSASTWSLEADLAARAAVSMPLTNTATKLVFRSTDPKTMEPLHALCPQHPGLDAVTRVRPVTTLAPGECYALLPDGRFERRRLDPFEAGAGRAQGRQESTARA